MVKTHNADLDRKDSEIKRLLNEAVVEKNRTDDEMNKTKTLNLQELTQFRNDQESKDSEHRRNTD